MKLKQIGVILGLSAAHAAVAITMMMGTTLVSDDKNPAMGDGLTAILFSPVWTLGIRHALNGQMRGAGPGISWTLFAANSLLWGLVIWVLFTAVQRLRNRTAHI